MPYAFKAHADHPTVQTLLRLHSDIAGRLLDNKKQADRLRSDMKHVEAVIKMFDPAFSARGIAVRRRKLNPWFKRGTLFRHALDVLREAQGPLTARQITERVLAAKGISATPQQTADLISGVRASLENHEGKSVARAEGHPARWGLVKV